MPNDVRGVLLTVIQAQTPRDRKSNLQSSSVLRAAAAQLSANRDHVLEQAILTQFHKLFRTGYLAWGHNINNPDPPFFHLTEQGLRTLAQLSRDPGNPTGYLSHVQAVASLGPVTRSYLHEAVRCYVADLHKSSAVMVGGAAESVVLEVRDEIAGKMSVLGRSPNRDVSGWRMKRILDGIKAFFDAEKRNFPTSLREGTRRIGQHSRSNLQERGWPPVQRGPNHAREYTRFTANLP
jgi:hypothetical protein